MRMAGAGGKAIENDCYKIEILNGTENTLDIMLMGVQMKVDSVWRQTTSIAA
jgi:hypothetical protein